MVINSTLTTKIRTAAAATAVATAVALAPVPTANAQPLAPLPQAVGSSAAVVIAPACNPAVSQCASSFSSTLAPGDGVRSLIQNRLWWFGVPNPTPPERATVLVFTPIALIPGFLKPIYSWFTQNLNFEACVFGASVQIGPYGTVTASIGRGC